MKWVPDKTRRFAMRPYYEVAELDADCEAIVVNFLTRRLGRVRLPITTDELTVLIEQEGAVLDSSTDLSVYGADVEGVTSFVPGELPKVSISDRLAGDPLRETRHRMTLAHEFAHVRFHGPLFMEKFASPDLFAGGAQTGERFISRGADDPKPGVDWMEWQAAFAASAILMPRTRTQRTVADYGASRGLHTAIPVSSVHASTVVGMTARAFSVSEQAARIRLLTLGLLTERTGEPSLFA